MTERPSQTSSCLSALTARRSSLARRRNGCISCTVSRSPLRRPVTRKLSRRCSELPPPAAADTADDRSTCSVCSSDEQSQSAPFSMYNGDRRSCNTTPSHRPQTPPPGAATWEVTLSARKVYSPMRLLACSWYYCAQFIAKPKAACALRFSWAATSSNLGL